MADIDKLKCSVCGDPIVRQTNNAGEIRLSYCASGHPSSTSILERLVADDTDSLKQQLATVKAELSEAEKIIQNLTEQLGLDPIA